MVEKAQTAQSKALMERFNMNFFWQHAFRIETNFFILIGFAQMEESQSAKNTRNAKELRREMTNLVDSASL